jgi:hypothetical protein
MRPLRAALLIPLLALLGCTKTGGAPMPVVHQDGAGVILSFEKRVAIWVTIRATPESRANGWKERPQSPVLVFYDARGFNPAFTGGARLRVEWLDGDLVVRVDEAGEGKHVSPTQEITAALLVPEGVETGLKVGDRILVVEDRP